MSTILETLAQNNDAFLKGLAVTLQVTLIACLAGSVIGFLHAVIRNRWERVNWVTSLLVNSLPNTLKSIPILVLLVWFHYVIPSISGVTPTPFLTTAVVLSISVAIGVSEIALNSIRSIPDSEIEAAKGLGFTDQQINSHILIPIAMRTAAPPMLYLYIETLKLSTFASVIALGELLHTTDLIISANYQALPAYSALAVIFLLIVVPSDFLVSRIAQRFGIRR